MTERPWQIQPGLQPLKAELVSAVTTDVSLRI
jgi:hypothetical protein